MDENMNGNQPQGMGDPQGTNGNQSYYGQTGMDQNAYNQQYYGQAGMDPNAYNQQYYGQAGMDPNAYNQQYYGQAGVDPNTYNQQYYNQPYGQPNMNAPQGGSGKGGFDINKIKDAVIKNKNIIIVAVAAIVAVILVWNILGAIVGKGKQSPKSVAKAYVKAIEQESGKKAYKLLDRKLIKYAEDEEDMDKDDIIDELDDLMEYYYENLQSEADEEDIGDIKSIKVKVKRVKQYKGDDLEDIQDDLEDEADIKVSRVAQVKVKLTLKGEDGTCTVNQTVLTYKRAGKWYWCYSY